MRSAAYDAGQVIVAAIKRVIAEKQPVNSRTMRDAIQTTR